MNSPNLENLKASLSEQAKRKYGEISKPSKCITWDDCYTIHEDHLVFWFNIEDESTKVLKHPL
jgi:hypothetical protein